MTHRLLAFKTITRSEKAANQVLAEFHKQIKLKFAILIQSNESIDGVSEIELMFGRFAMMTILAYCEFELKPTCCDKPKSSW